MTNDNTVDTRSQAPMSSPATNQWRQNTYLANQVYDKHQDVQHSLCDSEDQDRVLGILEKRMSFR